MAGKDREREGQDGKNGKAGKEKLKMWSERKCIITR